MADVIEPDASDAETLTSIALAELLFFAYRDFTGGPDALLEKYGFGRAHHRVLHFVNRNPGLRVSELLDILKITKQSLARVLKQLIKDGFIVQHEGQRDRRKRHLYATAAGEQLARELSDLQVARIGAATREAGGAAQEAARRFLFAMIAEADRAKVKKLTKSKVASAGAEEG